MRSWHSRRQQEMSAWNPQIVPLANGYLKWKYGEANCDPGLAPTPHDSDSTPASTSSEAASASSDGTVYTLDVYEIFTMERSRTITRPPTSTSVAADFAEHGFLVKTPVLPTAAVGFRTLELFDRIRARKPSMSVEAFTQVMCDYYMVGIFFLLGSVVISPLQHSFHTVDICAQYYPRPTRSTFV